MELYDIVPTCQEAIRRTSRNRWTGCWTRESMDLIMENTDFDGYLAVYWDCDGVKKLNTLYGKLSTSIRFAVMGRSDQDFVGHWFSGDEMVAIIRATDIDGFIERMSLLLQSVSMSATFAVVEPTTEAIDQADLIVDAEKQAGNRAGLVYDCRPDKILGLPIEDAFEENMSDCLDAEYQRVALVKGETEAILYCDEDWAELYLRECGFPEADVQQFIKECWEADNYKGY